MDTNTHVNFQLEKDIALLLPKFLAVMPIFSRWVNMLKNNIDVAIIKIRVTNMGIDL